MKARNFIMAFLFALSTIGLAQAQTVVSREFPLCFRWDNPHYDKTYLENESVEKELFGFVDSLETTKIEQIIIETYASPEGAIYRNNELCKQRAAELKWLLLKRFPETRGKFMLRSAGESWAKLRERVANDKKISDASREKILRILDDNTISLDTRKYRLSKTLGTDPKVGDLWLYLLRYHYRYIRCGAIVIVVVRDTTAVDTAAPSADAAAHSADAAASSVIPSEAKEPAPSVIPSEAKESAEAKEPADTVAAKPLIDSTLSQTLPPETTQEESGQTADIKPVKRHERKPLLGISTNLIYDATYIPHYGFTSIPSLSLEYYPYNGRWTIGADVEWPMWRHWDTHDFMQINNITLWVRRYFSPDLQLYKGAYLFGNVNAVQYGIGWDDKGWEGEGLGGSLGIGYKKYFGNSRFYFDTGLAAGVFWSQYDPYVWGNEATGWYYYDYAGKPEDFRERGKRLLWFGPTRLYFSIGYDLLMRKKR
jgi:hypothetical protein